MTTIHLNDDWEIGDEIGSGGFAKVYLASSNSVPNAVAKFVPKEPGAERELFEDLTDALNVVPVIDTGEIEDYFVLIMPKAEKSLRQFLEEKSTVLGEAETVSILQDIALALSSIDEKVVHRDLKPENVMLYAGRWCLIDFGIARYAEASTAGHTKKFSMTPKYASPEQWRHEHTTGATDIYSFGVMGYELVSGSAPFEGPSIENFRHQHLNSTPSSIENISSGLASIIAQCLTKIAGSRPTASRVLAQLQSLKSPISEAARRLQAANLVAVTKRTEEERQETIAEEASKRKNELFAAAVRSFNEIQNSLRHEVLAIAPESETNKPSMELNGARLGLSQPVQYFVNDNIKDYECPFDLIAFADVQLRIANDQRGYEGRSHSLWYCDAKTEGVYRWYETSFMFMASSQKRGVLDPFSLEPSDEAFGALSNDATGIQMAWPFTPVDQGETGEFIDQWIGWFADAAMGKLRHPSRMPEKQPKDSWRRSGG